MPSQGNELCVSENGDRIAPKSSSGSIVSNKASDDQDFSSGGAIGDGTSLHEEAVRNRNTRTIDDAASAHDGTAHGIGLPTSTEVTCSAGVASSVDILEIPDGNNCNETPLHSAKTNDKSNENAFVDDGLGMKMNLRQGRSCSESVSGRLCEQQNNDAIIDSDVRSQIYSTDTGPSQAKSVTVQNPDVNRDAGERSQIFSTDIGSSQAAKSVTFTDFPHETIKVSAPDEASSLSENKADSPVLTATSTWAKQRCSIDSHGTGAVQVDERAPQLNRRFFRGLNRPSARQRARARRARAREEREGADDGEARAQDGGGGAAARGERSQRYARAGTSRAEGLRASVARTMDFFVAATLVEDEGEVVVAERVGFFDRRGKVFGCAALVLVVILSVVLGVTLTAAREREQRERDQLNAPAFPSTQPSSSPSSSPSYDPRPTLNIVQDRGYVKCGLWVKDLVSKEGLNYQLCRAIAAVLLGNPDNFEGIVVTNENRFQQLHARKFDLLLWGDSHTIEREVREKTTEAGFAFSTPYNYDGLAYFGESKYVKCAENELRYGDCSRLRICAWGGDPLDYVVSAFPLDFIGRPNPDSFWNGTCNVIAELRSYLLNYESSEENIERGYVVGDKIMTKEPLAVVTRNDDHEFSNIVHWVINSLFYGEEQGLEKDSSLCQDYTNLTAGAADLNFLNAVYCVGNYGEIYGNDNRGMNRMNNGTGMIYAIPFGNLDRPSDHPFSGDMVLRDIKDARSLNCGVTVPVGFTVNITDNLAGLGADYCRTLAAALFNGNPESVQIHTFPENDDSSFSALKNGTIDALAGGSRQWKYYFASSMYYLGFHFSTPYYYGNESSVEDINVYSLVTREDDVVFSSFVECIVLATIYAQENGIKRADSKRMPLISLFGSDFNWALRDAVYYSGGYDEMYAKNFGNAEKEDRGRNVLNSESGPQIHSFPGIDVVVQKDNTLDGG